MKRASKTLELNDIPDACERLQELGVKRNHYIRAVIREMNATRALVRRALGFQWDMDEAARNKINRRAHSILSSALDGSLPDADDEVIAVALSAEFDVCRLMVAPAEAQRAVIEREMRSLARTLPVWSWAQNVKGLSDLGVAIIVAEAGNLSNYPTISKLRKRLGLSPKEKDGVTRACSTWAMKQNEKGALKLTASEWTDESAAGPKYKPKRRAAIYSQVGQQVIGFMQKGPRPFVGEDVSDREDLSPYQKMFINRLRHEAARDPENMARPVTKEGKESFSKWAAFRAQRYVEQKVIKNLQQAWRRSAGLAEINCDIYDSAQADRSALTIVSPVIAMPSASIPAKAGKRRATRGVQSISPLPAATSSAQAERSANRGVTANGVMPSASIPAKAGKRRATLPLQTAAVMPAANSSAQAERSATGKVSSMKGLPSEFIPVKAGKRRAAVVSKSITNMPAANSSTLGT